jgi:GT2 family glycosyltransferase
MEETLDLSIVIVSYNTKKILSDCLKSIKKTMTGDTITYEVIVIDNNSLDGTREMLKIDFPDVVTILNDGNAGFGKANNQGIKIAKGKYVLLLNSDTVVLPQAIQKLLTFAKQKGSAFVGPKLLNADRTAQTSVGPFFSLWVVFAALFLKGDKIGITRQSPDRICRVDWLSGACILGLKKLFTDGLLFDEGIFMYMEEIDLLYRARQKGIKTYFYPFSRIIHLGAASSTNKRKGPVLNIYRGLVYLYKKHYGVVPLFFLRIMLKTKAAFAWFLGIIIGNTYLKETYGEAYKLV